MLYYTQVTGVLILRHSCATVAIVAGIILGLSMIPQAGARHAPPTGKSILTNAKFTVFTGLRAYALTQHRVLSALVLLASIIQPVTDLVLLPSFFSN